MKILHSIISYLLIGVHVLLTFLLIFEDSVSIPLWLNPIGRMHPLLLHLPIGLLVLAGLFWIFRKEFEEGSFHKINRFVLAFTAIFAAGAALMGFFLSTEPGYAGETLTRHKWSGVGLSFICYGIYTFYDQLFGKKNVYPALLGVGSVLLIVTGHLGANLTHGEEFLFEALNSTQERQYTVDNTMYEAVVFPILEAKCVACHNDNKIKGELNMASVAKILQGGKNGPIWIPGDAENSHFLQRANLPLDDKKHMPPRGKSQLTDNEILVLTTWVNSGAATDIAVKDYADSLKIKQLALAQLENTGKQEAKIYDFSPASAATIEAVNTPFCTVAPIANGSPALKANFYVAQRFDRETLKNLSKVSEQLIELNLSKMPLTDDDLSLLSKFENLEKLILNGTNITGDKLNELLTLKKLTTLAVSNTDVDAKELAPLLGLPNLRNVFVWSTAMTEKEINALDKKYKHIAFGKGYIPDESEMIALNAPVIKNEERVLTGKVPVKFDHPLPNVTIKYTTDGSEPDSTNGKTYTKPFVINDFTTIKAVALKEGWYKSNVVQKSFYKSNFKAEKVELVKPPNPQYRGNGAEALTDLELGERENFKDFNWLGFKENDLEAVVQLKPGDVPKAITLNYMVNLGGYILPPTIVQVWGSDNATDWKLINEITPKQAESRTLNATIGVNLSLNNEKFQNYKVTAKPIKKLPKWHQGAGEPGWLFVDEIFFN